jgi:predicted nucleic acid-binding protein
VSRAYLDTSFLLAILLGDPRERALRRALVRYDELLAGDLLVAETLATARRERLDRGSLAPALEAISLVLPDRSLEPEMVAVLDRGHLRGADLWHLACALFVAGDARREVDFLSRDAPQRAIARRLGFRTP